MNRFTQLADALDGISASVVTSDKFLREAAAILRGLDAEPVAWAISYDGKTPYKLADYGDCPLLDAEVNRCGGTACKMPLYTTPPDAAARIAELEQQNAALRADNTALQNNVVIPLRSELDALRNQPPPDLPEPDIHQPFLSEVRKVYQGDYYRADKVLPLLKNWAVLYAASKAGHEQAFTRAIELQDENKCLRSELAETVADNLLFIRDRDAAQEQVAALHSELVEARSSEGRLQHDATRALEAWDCTVLPKSRDGMMQERMECLRTAIASIASAGEKK